jgi:hypothetical protein
MSKLFTVTMKFTAVVAADSEAEAHRVAHECRREIAGDIDQRATEITAKEVGSDHDLPPGWDGGCLPYGWNDEASIRDHLATSRRAPAPPADGQELPALGWQPLTKAGQIQKGDKLRFTCGDKAFEETARLILEPDTDKEEVVYNIRQNFYFITSMAIKGTSSHKGVEFIAAKQVGKEGGA